VSPRRVLRIVISAILVGGIADDLTMYVIGGGLLDTTDTVRSNIAFETDSTEIAIPKRAEELAAANAQCIGIPSDPGNCVR